MTQYIQIPLPLPDTTIEIPLTMGYVGIISSIDADLVLKKWHVNIYSGCIRMQTSAYHDGKTYHVYIHRVILGRILGRELESSELVDHIDGNPLNNTRRNLRLATHAENMRNRKTHLTKKDHLKGVRKNSVHSWSASICVDRKIIPLGVYKTEEEAYNAYCEAAIKYHGKFARLK